MTTDYRRKTDSLPTCMNCSSVLYGAYCSQCGQRETETLTFSRLRASLLRDWRTLDLAWIRTASALTTDPGRMVRHYLRGRRKPYVPPLSYALATTTLLALAVSLGLDLGKTASDLTPWASGDSFSAVVSFLAGIYGGLMVALGVAGIQRMLHRKAPYGLLETWVFTLYVFGHLAVHQTIFALVGAFSSTLGLLALAAMIVLVLAFALAGFYRLAIWRSMPAALILAVCYVAGVFVVSALARLALP
ncbi:MAG: DUF3667 domain-containing protein [Acidobacteriota bacterium]